MGNSNMVTGVSPQTSPLVSPRASSTSADWNGRANSSERDEIESSDDMDKYRVSEFESKPSTTMTGGVSGLCTEELGRQPSTSFPNIGIYDRSYLQHFKMENDTIAAALGESGVYATDMIKENSDVIPPGNYNLPQWGEVPNQGNVQGNNESLLKYQNKNEEKNILTNLLVASHEGMVQRLRSNQAPVADMYSMTVTQPQGSSEVNISLNILPDS